MRQYLREMAEPRSSEPVVLLNEVFPGDTNALDTLFGGRLMSIMDTAAGMAASQFAHNEFVTVSVDALKFKRPAYQGDVIRTIARVAHSPIRATFDGDGHLGIRYNENPSLLIKTWQFSHPRWFMCSEATKQCISDIT